MPVSVQHNSQDQEFTIEQEGHSAELAYSLPAANLIDFTHTFVEEALRGQGIGDTLARAGLAYARQQNLKVRTSCSFMRGFVAQHPEYQSLLDGAGGGA